MTGAIVREGAVPAFTAVVDGVPAIGLTGAELERFLERDGIAKVSARDLGVVIARAGTGATTVAGALALIARSEVGVFATGGIGGVHRAPRLDESADLLELSRTPVVVVCTGAKAILDLDATLERLETLGIPVIGFRTSTFPAFFTASSGLPLATRVETVSELCAIVRAHRGLGRREAVLVVQPPPDEFALAPGVVDQAVEEALGAARAAGIRGAAVTPFLLASVEHTTHGRSLETNLALLEANAGLAARLASALMA
jgi:pseudouridine-5'-phosphate glycosidase